MRRSRAEGREGLAPCYVVEVSLAASPSLPDWSQVHAQLWRRGSSKLCSRLNFHYQSDHTEMIRFNTIHDSSSCKQAVRMSDQPCESVWKGTLELNLSYLDASQGTELALDSNCHTTGSQVTCNWHSRKTRSSAKFARPFPPTACRFAAHPRNWPGGEGLAARLDHLWQVSKLHKVQ